MKSPLRSIVSTHSRILAIVLCYLLLFTQTSWAALPLQQAAPIQPAPIQRQPSSTTYSNPEAEAQLRLANAHSLFLANDGEDDTFPTSAGDGYTRFVTDIQAWGRYRIVNNIADADLVLQFRAASTTTVVDGTTDSPSATVYHTPYFKLTLADPANLRPIWPITVPVQIGKAKKTKANLFSYSAENAVSQIKLLINEPLTSEDQIAMAATVQNARLSKTGMWVLLGTVTLIAATAIATPIIMNDEYNDAVAKQKQDGLNFCKQNHIVNCPF